jgi:hypothetical protein
MTAMVIHRTHQIFGKMWKPAGFPLCCTFLLVAAAQDSPSPIRWHSVADAPQQERHHVTVEPQLGHDGLVECGLV